MLGTVVFILANMELSSSSMPWISDLPCGRGLSVNCWTVQLGTVLEPLCDLRFLFYLPSVTPDLLLLVVDVVIFMEQRIQRYCKASVITYSTRRIGERPNHV